MELQKRNVFLYWIGKEYKLISILRNLIYLHSNNGIGYNIILITPENIKDYVDNIPDYFYNLAPAHQADFVRVNVICDYGGIWLDSDTLVLDSLDSLFDIIENKDGFFIKENNNTLCNGIFGSKKETNFMKEWKKKLRIKLDSTRGKINWLDLGSEMIQGMFNLNPTLFENYKIFLGLDNLYPVNWNNCVTELITKPYDNYKNIIRDYQPLLVLVNSVYHRLEHKTINEILNGNMPINYFINKSFENIGISKNKLNNGYQIYNYGDKDYISKSIIDFKTWEPRITCLMNNIINKNEYSENIILDIGCNIGYYTLITQKYNSISHVYSVDGNNMNINLLKLSCGINNISNTTLINKVISDKPGESFETANQDLVDRVNNIGGLSYKKSENNTDILSTTIDELIEKNKVTNILIMKIDIEGGELNSLKGATTTLKTNIIKNIIIEISPKFNNDSKAILDILHENEYDLYNIPNQERGYLNTDNNLLENIKSTPIRNISEFVSSIPIKTNILATKNMNSYLKIVIYADWIESYLTLEHFKFIKNLEHSGWKLIKLSEIDVEKLKKEKTIILCVTYDSFDISRLTCENIKLIYKIDDLYPYKNIRKICVDSADFLIGPYQYLFKKNEITQMYPSINSKESFHIPYSAVDSFYKNIDFNDNPKEKIFVSGAIDNRYPLRQYILKFSEYIERLEHPRYNNYIHKIINEEYYKKISEYLCCFTDSSCYNYILLKVFEICSVGCLLLCDDSIENQLCNLGFYDNIHYIVCNKHNIELKIKWILNKKNRKLVDEIRLRGMELVRNNHSTSHRSVVFNTIINNKYFKETHLAVFNNDLDFTPDKIQVEI
jgi:FkbM family methyltransferase